MLGVRHQPHHVAVGVDDAGDAGDRPVRALALVTKDDLARSLELSNQVRVGEEAAFAVLDRDAETLSHCAPSRERRIGPLDRERHVAANKTQGLVWSQGAREQARLAQDLKAVADSQDEPAVGSERPDRLHHGCESSQRTGPDSITT